MTGELLLNQSWSRIEMTIDGWIPEIETKGNEIHKMMPVNDSLGQWKESLVSPRNEFKPAAERKPRNNCTLPWEYNLGSGDRRLVSSPSSSSPLWIDYRVGEEVIPKRSRDSFNFKQITQSDEGNVPRMSCAARRLSRSTCCLLHLNGTSLWHLVIDSRS